MSVTEIDTARDTLEQPADGDEVAPDAEKGQLFDKSQYDREDLAIPKVDGEGIDKICVKVAGSIMLDRSDPADVALFNKLTLGKECELRCAGSVSGVGTRYATNRDGDLDAIVGEKTVNVETVWILDPEQL